MTEAQLEEWIAWLLDDLRFNIGPAALPDPALHEQLGRFRGEVRVRAEIRAQNRANNDGNRVSARERGEPYIQAWCRTLAKPWLVVASVEKTREYQNDDFDQECRMAGVPLLDRVKQRGRRAKYKKLAEQRMREHPTLKD